MQINSDSSYNNNYKMTTITLTVIYRYNALIVYKNNNKFLLI